jgi:NitT/TauT family transport system ATP-binding protein
MGDDKIKHIEVSNVKKSFNNNIVLEDVNFFINKGEFICLIGKTGCGKSTLLRIMAGFEKPDLGDVFCNKEKIFKPNMKRAYIFQDFNQLLPWKTVKENIMYPLILNKHGTKRECEIEADNYLLSLKLKEYSTFYPHALSCGTKQLVALARALAMKPEIIFMDEPFSSVDAQTRDYLHDKLLSIWKKLKLTILFVTHNIEEAIHLSTRILVLKGKPSKITDNISNNICGNKKPSDDGYSTFWNLLYESIERM